MIHPGSAAIPWSRWEDILLFLVIKITPMPFFARWFGVECPSWPQTLHIVWQRENGQGLAAAFPPGSSGEKRWIAPPLQSGLEGHAFRGEAARR